MPAREPRDRGRARRSTRPRGGRIADRAMPAGPPPWASLRLRDRIAPELKVLFVGINPGVQSAITGHHFAGFSNRFWKLLAESRLVPEAITSRDDERLLEWGYGVTNLVARPSPGIDDLEPAEYVAGWKILERKIAKFRPRLIVLVGVTAYRAVLPLLDDTAAAGPPAGAGGKADRGRRVRAMTSKEPTVLGLRPHTVHGARLFVLPNPSGRNANYSYVEMLDAFKALKELITANS